MWILRTVKSHARKITSTKKKKENRKKSFLQWNKKVFPYGSGGWARAGRGPEFYKNSNERENCWENRDFTSESTIRANEWGANPRMRECRACSRGVCGVYIRGILHDGRRRGMIRSSRDNHLSGPHEWSSCTVARVGTRACSCSCNLWDVLVTMWLLFQYRRTSWTIPPVRIWWCERVATWRYDARQQEHRSRRSRGVVKRVVRSACRTGRVRIFILLYHYYYYC